MPNEILGGQIASITQDGEALIAELIAAKQPIEFTRAQIGGGPMPEGQQPYTMTGASGYVMEAMIEGASNPRRGFSVVGIQVSSLDVLDGFGATNVALMAQHGASEICYAYLSLHDHPEWIYPDESGTNKLARFLLGVEVRSVPIVNAVINPDVLITFEQMQSYFINTVLPVCLSEIQRVVYEEHDPDPEAHEPLQALLRRLSNRIDAIEKLYGGRVSQDFLFDFMNLTGIQLDQGVYNIALRRIEY
jgi:hypothetical protein